VPTSHLVVRVNGDAANQQADLQGLRGTTPRAVLLPKYENPAQLAELRQAMQGAGLPASTQVWVMIETPIGIAQAGPLLAGAQGDYPLAAVVIGTNDIARLTGTSMGDGRRHLLPWLSLVLIHAKAANLAVLDGVYNDFADTEGFAAEVRQGRDMGFDGKTLIHPSQVAPANAGFAPSEAQVAWARAVTAAFALPENASKGAIQIEGEMVERLHLEIAQRVLAAAG
jgi:citrate lyase subunit beta/citryl-CoA lyase